MAAYVIADVDVTDPTGFAEPYGGRFLIRGGAHDVAEGDWRPTRVVVLEFPTMAAARRWYDSEEYRSPKALRLRSARTHLVFVEGV